MISLVHIDVLSQVLNVVFRTPAFYSGILGSSLELCVTVASGSKVVMNFEKLEGT
jgi:hypothetical protein